MSIWLEDADAIKMGDDTLKVIYKNNCIREYLSQSKILGLSGTKGQGKTFLIKAKRLLLQSGAIKKDVPDVPVVCFPKDALMVDTLDNALIPHRSLVKYITSYDVWVRIWKFSIAVTIISSKECGHFFTSTSFNKLKKITKTLLQTRNSNCKPSVIIHELFSLTIKDFQTALDDTNSLQILLNDVHHGVYVFIDKVEHGFSEELKKASQTKREKREKMDNWYFSQYALAQAAYDLSSNVNAHIKVYYTIRHEALLNSHDMAPNISRNVETYITELSYSKYDLYKMFSLYVENEAKENLNKPELKSQNPELAFLGFDKIKHPYVTDSEGVPHYESVFDYIYRHSLRRPCDLMLLCRKIYESDPTSINSDIFRKAINSISGRVLKRYLAEVEPFTVFSYKNIEDLLKCINTNIFDKEYMAHICERFNNEYGSSLICKKDCANCKQKHPFSTLYNIGLIGYLHDSMTAQKFEQKFLPIGDSRPLVNEQAIKESNLYLLHPCLWDIARDLRNSNHRSYAFANETVVGDGVFVETSKAESVKSRLSTLMKDLDEEKVFVTSTIEDLKKERKVIKSSLISKGYYPLLSESDNFRDGSNNVDSHDHCIDELLKCTKMIFVIGSKWGGKYSGDKYKAYVTNINNDSLCKIDSPSISLMEFYVAKRNNLSYKVFIAKNVLDRVSAANKDSSINLEDYGIDFEVKILVNFVNHISTNGVREGNWMNVYNDISDLRRRISNIGF